MPSERSFGYLFTAVFALIAGVALYRGQPVVAVSLLGLSLLFLLASLIWPPALRPANIAWYWLGKLLGAVTEPIVLGVLFLVFVTPIALVGKLRHRDVLRLKKKQLDSYWITREPAGPTGDSLKNQY